MTDMLLKLARAVIQHIEISERIDESGTPYLVMTIRNESLQEPFQKRIVTLNDANTFWSAVYMLKYEVDAMDKTEHKVERMGRGE